MIRIGITVFKMFILGGMLLDIHSEIMFTALLSGCHKTRFSTVCLTIFPQMKILNTVILKVFVALAHIMLKHRKLRPKSRLQIKPHWIAVHVNMGESFQDYS